MPIALEIKQKKVIDNEDYTFDDNDTAEIIPENDWTLTNNSISDNQRFCVNDNDWRTRPCVMVTANNFSQTLAMFLELNETRLVN